MSWLLAIGLKNVILAMPLVALALFVGRYWRRPALAHLLWAVVLVKLLTPPLVDVPLGWQLDVEGWLGQQGSDVVAAVDSTRSESPLSSQVPGATRVSPRETSRNANRVQRNIVAGRRATTAGNSASVGRPATHDGASGWTWTNIQWIHVAGIFWLGGSLVLLALLARRVWQFRRYLRQAAKRDEYLPVRMAELAAATGVRLPPRVIVVDGIVSPMLWGLGQRACVIFPAQLARRLSPAKLDSLLLHELAHFARKDHWMRALELAAFVLYWWNPIVWFARREIEAAEEECCDAWVVEKQRGTRHSYADALLTTIDFLCERPAPMPPAACGLGEVSLIRARLTQIMRGQSASGLSRAIQALVIAVGLLLAPLEPALWATSSSTPAELAGSNKALPSTPRKPTIDRKGVKTSVKALDANALPRLPAKSGAGSPLNSVDRIAAPPPRPPSVLWATAVSPNGKSQIEARAGKQIRLVQADLVGSDSDPYLDLSSHRITCVAFAPNSRTFVTGHEDTLARLWDAQTGGIVHSFRGSNSAITCVQISPDGNRVAAGTRDGSVWIWDLATGDEITRLPRQDAPVSCLRWSKDGDRLAIALGAWSQRDQAMLLIWSPQRSAMVTEQPLPEPVGAIDWLGDQSLIVAAWNGQCQVWDFADGQSTSQFTVEKDQVSAAAWSPNCPLISKWDAEQLASGAP